MEKLRDDDIAEFKEAFSLFDRDGDGRVTTQDVGTVMRALGLNPTEAEMKEMLAAADVNQHGTVDFPEFLTLMAGKARHAESEHELLQAFQVFDKNGKGFISAAELRHIMTNLGERMTDTEINEIFREVDVLNKDGNINYKDFVKMLISK